MYKEIAKLVIYRGFSPNSILASLAGICEDFDRGDYVKEELIARIYTQIHRLLDVATKYGFDKNLWHNYLAFLLVMDENPFSLVSEKVGASDGSVNHFAKNDFKIFKNLFEYDFDRLEKTLGIDCFSTITDYRAIVKREQFYNKSVSQKVQALSEKIETAGDEQEIYQIVTDFYMAYGVGMFGLNKAFAVDREEGGLLKAITNTGDMTLDTLIGYESQKQQIVENTEAFVQGKKANNVLLYGDAGTGKSTCIKAVLNRYYDQGLRMIEVYKHQFKDLTDIIAYIKNRNYKFIIYMDDLSFEEFEIEYKYLKAVIEGGLEAKPDNVLIYATSNRRHLIRETWSDRSDMSQDELHRSDTMQEKLSLAARFGVSIFFGRPENKQFYDIVLGLAKRHPEIQMSEEELRLAANRWELSHGGKSGRAAKQLIDYLLGAGDIEMR